MLRLSWLGAGGCSEGCSPHGLRHAVQHFGLVRLSELLSSNHLSRSFTSHCGGVGFRSMCKEHQKSDLPCGASLPLVGSKHGL